ncbi:regulator of microtubule dynamics protein 1 isoform X1 [Anabrus simplex]|uniref:regulator of microtubule dynamics protein 1 isoform X1 n=1 Tax=Anabrus simplex TaxID=316456 RepID=UPI0035A276E5
MLQYKSFHYRLAYNLFRYAVIISRRKILAQQFPVKHFAVHQYRLHVGWIPLFTVLYAAVPEKKQQGQKVSRLLLDRADELYNANRYEETYNSLKEYQDTDDVEVLWRLSRALYSHSKQERDSKKKKELVAESFRLIKHALSLEKDNWAVHKWYAVLLDANASHEGIKARISELTNVKHHLQKAAELNPTDATTLYMLGSWCYGIADMPWYQRKIASTLFATPPYSSYEEALSYFLKAEETDPNFYSLNLLMLGKSYMQLQNPERAKHYLKLASLYPAKTDEDFEATKEATELLKKIKL